MLIFRKSSSQLYLKRDSFVKIPLLSQGNRDAAEKQGIWMLPDQAERKSLRLHPLLPVSLPAGSLLPQVRKVTVRGVSFPFAKGFGLFLHTPGALNSALERP